MERERSVLLVIASAYSSGQAGTRTHVRNRNAVILSVRSSLALRLAPTSQFIRGNRADALWMNAHRDARCDMADRLRGSVGKQLSMMILFPTGRDRRAPIAAL